MAKKKKRKSKNLNSYAEEFAISLIYEATNGKVGKGKDSSLDTAPNPISFRDRGKLLDSVTKLLGAQDTPEDNDDEDGIESFRERLNERGTSSSGTDDTEGSSGG